MCTRKGYAASVSQLALATAALYFPLLIPHSWGKRSAAQPKTIYSEVPHLFPAQNNALARQALDYALQFQHGQAGQQLSGGQAGFGDHIVHQPLPAA